MIGTWIRIGARNLLQNPRRTSFTVLAVTLGYLAVNLFGGYMAYIFTGMREGYVHAYANGHLALFKPGFLEDAALLPEEHLFTPAEIEAIGDIARQDQRVLMVSPQLEFMGMIDSGTGSSIFAGFGRVPEDIDYMRSRATSFVGRLEMFDGRPLSSGENHKIGVSRGLSAKLDLLPGADAILLATTVDGQMNAIDAAVGQIFDAPFEVLDDILIDVPLPLARRLYDTAGADRLIILLEDHRQTAAVKAELEERIGATGTEVEIRDWETMCPSYRRIHEMYVVMFGFLFTIVMVIVTLSVINTVSMSVLERTREIGTLRALGLKRGGIQVMFATESAILGIAGSVLGFLLTVAVVLGLRGSGLHWNPPVVTRQVPFEVYLVPAYLSAAAVFMTILSIWAAILPAHRAARRGIVEALGHV